MTVGMYLIIEQTYRALALTLEAATVLHSVLNILGEIYLLAIDGHFSYWKIAENVHQDIFKYSVFIIINIKTTKRKLLCSKLDVGTLRYGRYHLALKFALGGCASNANARVPQMQVNPSTLLAAGNNG
jgi:hypothetical protein